MGTFEQIKFDPVDGLRDESYDTTPASEEAAREQIQGRLDELADQINSHLVNELENAEEFNSGAERIGSAAIAGVPDKFAVYDQLVELKAQLTTVEAGEVTVDSITNAKLAVDVKVGSLASLTTTETASVQGAINELDAEIGDITGLTTEAKTTLVAAINEIDSASVDTENIINGAVTETKLGAGAVTSTKVADSARSDSVSTASSTVLATSAAVKTAYDLANLDADQKRKITISSSAPSGGADGDIWLEII